jgi:hypothetical protein
MHEPRAGCCWLPQVLVELGQLLAAVLHLGNAVPYDPARTHPAVHPHAHL